MPLSDAKIRTLGKKEKPYKVADFDGLYILVKVSGSRSWRFKYRIAGKEKLLVIGDYPSVSLAQARQTRDAARAQLVHGIDPTEAKREKARADDVARDQTFAKVAKAFIAKITAEGRAEATLEKYDYLLGLLQPSIGDKPMTAITAPHVLDCLKKVEAKGKYETARKMRTMVGSVFRFAIATGLAEQDPTFALRGALISPKSKPRAAITDPKKLGGFLRAVGSYQGQATTRLALELMVLLFQRPGELRKATWAEIDFEKRVWSIPALHMKERLPHEVPLPTRAISLLTELRELTGHSKLLFPSIRTNRRPMSEGTLVAAVRRMGYGKEELSPHGLRATFSTLANESGLWNVDAIERALAHTEANEVRRAYARGQYWDERVRMGEWWGCLLEELKLSPMG